MNTRRDSDMNRKKCTSIRQESNRYLIWGDLRHNKVNKKIKYYIHISHIIYNVYNTDDITKVLLGYQNSNFH